MTIRVGYLSTSSLSIKELGNLSNELCQQEYSDDKSWGFVDVRNESGLVAATFVERFESEEEIIDPYGRVSTYTRVRYSQVKFRLGAKIPQLEVYDAPRSISPLLTELSNSLRKPIAFSRIGVDLNLFVKLLKRKASGVMIQGATLHDIALSADVRAKVSLIGGGEVSQFLPIASLGKRTVLDKVCILGTNEFESFRIEAASDGRLQIVTQHTDSALSFFRSILEGSISNTLC